METSGKLYRIITTIGLVTVLSILTVHGADIEAVTTKIDGLGNKFLNVV